MKPANDSNRIIKGIRKDLILRLMKVQILFLILGKYRSPLKAYGLLKKLMTLRRKLHGIDRPNRILKNGGRYYLSVHIPGWPSGNFRRFIQTELIRILPAGNVRPTPQLVIFAITRKCPLQCEHCFEWQNLDSTEVLSLGDLKGIVDKLYDLGISIIEISGGEPLSRFSDLCQLIRSNRDRFDFWILTSGYGLTPEKAKLLKQAGLTGMNISLDHWDAVMHNRFRGNGRAFSAAMEAVRLAREEGILAGLTLCTTRSFISPENLRKFIGLARQLGAGFVQFLEPRAVGHYLDKSDIDLSPEQKKDLRELHLKVNNDPAYIDYPFMIYPGAHQDHFGCNGAGMRYFYIDPTGAVHACPFCRDDSIGNILSENATDLLGKLQARGCHVYPTFHLS